MSTSISLMPHAVCWRADPRLIWVMVVANAITALSYLSICCTLLYLGRRTGRVLARDWVWFVGGFALFIVACGSTHLMEVVTTWVPWFWLDAWTNIVTAVLSAYVAVQLMRRLSQIIFSINDYAARLANTERENQRMQESLLADERLKDWSRTSTTVAHEIANPLETVQNLLYLIRESEGASPEVVAMAKTAAAESDRVLTIARSALGMFRQGTVPERVDLQRAAESITVLLENTRYAQQARLRIEAEGDVTVEALPGEARQALLNLVRNACEASEQNQSEVRVRLTGKPAGVEVTIADRGTGIAPELMPRLFEFGLSTKGEQGNGMGLWAVRHIVEKHGGQIAAQSTLGEGTVFTLWWPREFVSR